MAGKRPAGLRRQVLSAGDVAKRLRGFLENLPPVNVRGEVSGARVSPSGHLYFALSDEEARLECIAYRRSVKSVRNVIVDGDEVVVTGTVTFFPPGGRLQFVVDHAETAGEGAARSALRKLLAKLSEEGLFDEGRKKPLPKFPGRVAVVTSPNGAAVQDIIVSIRSAYPPAEILVVPVPVQGRDAAGEIAGAIHAVDRGRTADVMIVGRGGGSEEDLSAFNDERVVRAVAACRMPVVSAVGHEIDITLTDMAADARALTPTAAGRMVVPDAAELEGWIRGRVETMTAGMLRRAAGLRREAEVCAERLRRASPMRRIDETAQRLDAMAALIRGALRERLAGAAGRATALAGRLYGGSPARAVGERRGRMRFLAKRLETAAAGHVRTGRHELEKRTAKLDALSPLAVLGRGYSLTRRPGGEGIGSVRGLGAGDVLETIVRDGTIISKVEETREQDR
ncbi:MAG: exodeoxyribonuclease VII large subunit [Planctomycetes bacterium]|nr:exodeoxyribonuclease VII large subunit [Planctomycetota bacterium]